MTRKVASNRGNGPAGTIMRASGRHGPQVTQTTGRFWTDEAEAIFLDTLAATCNVTLAAAECGFSGTTVWRRRRQDAGFADRWRSALEQGYVRLETAIVGRAADRFDGSAEDDDGRPAVSTAEAINLLRLHRAGVAEGRVHPGRRRGPRPLEEVRASILVKLEAIVAMRDADAEAAARALDRPSDDA